MSVFYLTVFGAGILLVVAGILLMPTAATDKKCQRCHSKNNYLTHGGICEDCAWKEIDAPNATKRNARN